MNKPAVLSLFLLCCASDAATGNRSALSPSAFHFSHLPEGNGTMPAAAVVASVADAACGCRLRCLAKSDCRGYGVSETSGACIISHQLPTPGKLQPSSDVWQWHARGGRRQLNEPCSSQEECVVPGSQCRDNVCTCRRLWESSSDGLCRKTGGFSSVGTGRLTDSPLLEVAASSSEECKAACADNFTCMAFDFSPDEQRCTFYSMGITSDAGSGRDVQSFVWQFPAADGKPPADYQPLNGTYLGLRSSPNLLNGPYTCYPDGAILYPAVTTQSLQDVASMPMLASGHQDVIVGIDDIEVEGEYVASIYGDPIEDMPFSDNDAKSSYEDCVVANLGASSLGDFSCRSAYTRTALCQFIGENLVLDRPAWLSTAPVGWSVRAGRGVDGDVRSFAHTSRYGSHEWPPLSDVVSFTVDLGGVVQVTSILLVAREACCSPSLNRNTEYRVSFSSAADWRPDNSARCLLVTPLAVPVGYARMFRCDTPVTGRYLRVIRTGHIHLDFAELAVFGNRMD